MEKSISWGTFKRQKIGIPKPQALLYGSEKVSFIILGDDAFVLKNYMKKPCLQCDLTLKKQIYNYHRKLTCHSCKSIEYFSYMYAFKPWTRFFCNNE